MKKKFKKTKIARWKPTQAELRNQEIYGESVRQEFLVLKAFREFMFDALIKESSSPREGIEQDIAGESMRYFFRHDEIPHLKKLLSNPTFLRFSAFLHGVVLNPIISPQVPTLYEQCPVHHILLTNRFSNGTDRPHIKATARQAMANGRSDGFNNVIFSGPYTKKIKRAFFRSCGIQDFLNRKWRTAYMAQVSRTSELIASGDQATLHQLDYLKRTTGSDDIEEILFDECKRRRKIEEQEIWASASRKLDGPTILDIVLLFNKTYRLPKSTTPDHKISIGNLFGRLQAGRDLICLPFLSKYPLGQQASFCLEVIKACPFSLVEGVANSVLNITAASKSLLPSRAADVEYYHYHHNIPMTRN